jgi:circadian clock protein KaiB
MDRHRSSDEERIVLRLYVAGGAPHSNQALANLEAIFEAYAPPDGCRLEVVDVLEEPLRALEDGVFVTPTLVELSPTPVRIMGTLNEREGVARLLGLERE